MDNRIFFCLLICVIVQEKTHALSIQEFLQLEDVDSSGEAPDLSPALPNNNNNPNRKGDKEGYSKWTPWTPCSKRCLQRRLRRCNEPSACKEKVQRQTQPCYRSDSHCTLQKHFRKRISKKVEDIVFDMLYFNWTKWSACTRTCKQRRFRACALKRWCKNTLLLEEKRCAPASSKCEKYWEEHPEEKILTDLESLLGDKSDKTNQAAKAAEKPSKVSKEVIEPPNPETCGFRERAATPRIVGGYEAQRGAWPWLVAITTRRREQYCGGVLIAPSWVLTAAHCVRKNGRRRKVLVRVGEYDLARADGPEQDVKVVEDFVHTAFDMDTIDSDIALLKLAKPLHSGHNIRHACLPGSEDQLPVNTLCYAIGWGKLKDSHLFGTDVLREAPVPLVSKAACREAFQYEITDNQLCAGYRRGGVDTCSGDSGGPLMCSMPNADGDLQWYVYGVTSFGEGCGDKGKFGIYTKVTEFSDWIHNVTRAREDKSSPTSPFSL